MSIRTERISLDVRPCCQSAPQAVCGRQGDVGVVLEVSVTADGQAMDLSGLSATLMGNNPKLLVLDGTVSGSTASFTLPSAFFSAACTAMLYVKLSQGADVVASTQAFALKVAPGANLSASEATGYAAKLDAALETAQQASHNADVAADRANAAAESAISEVSGAITGLHDAVAAEVARHMQVSWTFGDDGGLDATVNDDKEA